VEIHWAFFVFNFYETKTILNDKCTNEKRNKMLEAVGASRMGDVLMVSHIAGVCH
jgi:hypothetical protein